MRKKKIVLLSLTSTVTLTLAALAVFLSKDEKAYRTDSTLIDYNVSQVFDGVNATAVFGEEQGDGYYPLTLTGRNFTDTYDIQTVSYDSSADSGTYFHIVNGCGEVEIIDGMPAIRFISSPCQFDIQIVYDLYENAFPKDGEFYACISFYESDESDTPWHTEKPDFSSEYEGNIYTMNYEYDDEYEPDYWKAGGYFCIEQIQLIYECE